MKFFFFFYFIFSFTNLYPVNIDQAYINAETYYYYARERNSYPKALDISEKFCKEVINNNYDSLSVKLAHNLLDRINSIRENSSLNLNHQIQLFDFLGLDPLKSYGFVDDAIEYSYENSIDKVLDYPFPGKAITIRNFNVYSIIHKESLDDDMYEINYQYINNNSNHYLLSREILTRLIGEEKANIITDGDLQENILDEICRELNVDEIGIFSFITENIVDDKLYYSFTKFKSYNTEKKQFTNPVQNDGFSEDKREVSLQKFLLVPFVGIIMIALIYLIISVFNRIVNNQIKYGLNQLIQKFKINLQIVLASFPLPLILSFILIFVSGYLKPDGMVHSGEIESILWIILISLSISFIPSFLNFFFISRIIKENFHSKNGYYTFFTTSLYASLVPLFLFYYIDFEVILPLILKSINVIFYLVLISYLVGSSLNSLISGVYFNQFSFSKIRFIKNIEVFFFLLGIIWLVVFGYFNLHEATAFTPPIYIILLLGTNGIHWYTSYYFKNNYKNEDHSEEKLNLDDVFIPTIDAKKITQEIENNLENNFDLMVISASQGMGKTTVLNKISQILKDDNYKVFYGDCDEFQDSIVIPYEPFQQAFKEYKEKNIFRSSSKIVSDVSDRLSDAIDFAAEGIGTVLKSSGEGQSVVELCIKLEEVLEIELRHSKGLLIIDDLQFIDDNSLDFFENFLKIFSKNKQLKDQLSILVSIRDSDEENVIKLNNDLKAILSKYGIGRTEILKNEQFDISNYISGISEMKPEFNLSSNALEEIQNLINLKLNLINEDLDEDAKILVTPKYIEDIINGLINKNLLLESSQGLILSRMIQVEDLSNPQETNYVYFQKFKDYDNKFLRLLESASYVGNKFDAKTLASVWNLDILNILDDLENAEKDNLIVDIEGEDDIYMFKEKRISSAIRSYFLLQFDGSKTDTRQINIEYSKRIFRNEIDKNKDGVINEKDWEILSKLNSEELYGLTKRAEILYEKPGFFRHSFKVLEYFIYALIDESKYLNARRKLKLFEKFISIDPEKKPRYKLLLLKLELYDPETNLNNVNECYKYFNENYKILKETDEFLFYELILKYHIYKKIPLSIDDDGDGENDIHQFFIQNFLIDNIKFQKLFLLIKEYYLINTDVKSLDDYNNLFIKINELLEKESEFKRNNFKTTSFSRILKLAEFQLMLRLLKSGVSDPKAGVHFDLYFDKKDITKEEVMVNFSKYLSNDYDYIKLYYNTLFIYRKKYDTFKLLEFNHTNSSLLPNIKNPDGTDSDTLINYYNEWKDFDYSIIYSEYTNDQKIVLKNFLSKWFRILTEDSSNNLNDRIIFLDYLEQVKNSFSDNSYELLASILNIFENTKILEESYVVDPLSPGPQSFFVLKSFKKVREIINKLYLHSGEYDKNIYVLQLLNLEIDFLSKKLEEQDPKYKTFKEHLLNVNQSDFDKLDKFLELRGSIIEETIGKDSKYFTEYYDDYYKVKKQYVKFLQVKGGDTYREEVKKLISELQNKMPRKTIEDSCKLYYRLYEQYYQLEDIENCIINLNEIIKLQSDSDKSLTELGYDGINPLLFKLYYYNQDYENSIVYLTKSVKTLEKISYAIEYRKKFTLIKYEIFNLCISSKTKKVSKRQFDKIFKLIDDALIINNKSYKEEVKKNDIEMIFIHKRVEIDHIFELVCILFKPVRNTKYTDTYWKMDSATDDSIFIKTETNSRVIKDIYLNDSREGSKLIKILLVRIDEIIDYYEKNIKTLKDYETHIVIRKFMKYRLLELLGKNKDALNAIIAHAKQIIEIPTAEKNQKIKAINEVIQYAKKIKDTKIQKEWSKILQSIKSS